MKSTSQGLEQLIDSLLEELEPLKEFILPGGTESAAVLHLARTVARRAERLVVALAAQAEINPHALIYLNRLSDLLFVMARAANATRRNKRGIGPLQQTNLNLSTQAREQDTKKDRG